MGARHNVVVSFFRGGVQPLLAAVRPGNPPAGSPDRKAPSAARSGHCLALVALSIILSVGPSLPVAASSEAAGSRIRIGPRQYGQVVAARLGDVLVLEVERPGSTVEFDREVLEAAGSETSSSSSPGGLLLRCIGVGRTELTLTAHPPPCPAGSPCPPALFEFRTSVDVRE